jgi:hypothetical protein
MGRKLGEDHGKQAASAGGWPAMLRGYPPDLQVILEYQRISRPAFRTARRSTYRPAADAEIRAA